MIQNKIKHGEDSYYGVNTNHINNLVLCVFGEGGNQIRLAFTPEEALELERKLRVARLQIFREKTDASEKRG